MITRAQADIRALEFLRDARIPGDVNNIFFGDIFEALVDHLHSAANGTDPRLINPRPEAPCPAELEMTP